MEKRKENALMLLSKFRTKILEGESILQPFSIRRPPDFYHFFTDKVGKAYFIYGIHTWNDKKVHADITNKVSPVAIVVKNNIIITDMLFFCIYSSDEITLPPNMMFLSTVTNNFNVLIQKAVFNPFYDALPVTSLEDKDYELRARKALLMGKTFSHTPPTPFSLQDVVNSLCGFINLEKEAKRKFYNNKEDWIRIKSEEAKISELLLNDKVADEWEKDMARALLNTDAVNVTVEFVYDEKSYETKMEPTRLLQNLVDKSYFSRYDFPTNNIADNISTKLGISFYTGDKNHLTCKHINKLTYRKKDLYVKEF